MIMGKTGTIFAGVILSLILFSGITVSSYSDYLSPKKQIESGVALADITCKDDHVAVIRTSGDPACVKNTTAEYLGWPKIEALSRLVNVINNQTSSDISLLDASQIPELLIYDEETESAVLSPEKIHGFSIRHGFAKINLDAFESDKILLNAFGESVVMYRDSEESYYWVGTSTENSGSPNAYFSIEEGLISGQVDDDSLGYLMMAPLGHDGDLHIIQEVDLSLIPELFIYDEETESATFSSESVDDFGVIRHSIGKMNFTVFDSGTFLFNAFGESIVINKHHHVQGSDWIGITRNSPISNVIFHTSNDMIQGGLVKNPNRDLFGIISLGNNDLYVIQEIDRSQKKEHPDNWGHNVYIEMLLKDWNHSVSTDISMSNNNGVVIGREDDYNLFFFTITPLGHDDLYTRQEIRSSHHKVKFSDDEITKIEQLWKDFDRVSMDAYLNKSNGMIMGTVDGSFGYFTINPLGYDNLYTIKEIDSSPHKDESDGLDEQIEIEKEF